VRLYLEKNPSQKRAGRVAQGEGPEFKSQYWKKKKMDWRCNSSCRTPVSTRVQNLVPLKQNKQKKTKKKRKPVNRFEGMT
jgi:hypothetical protein